MWKPKVSLLKLNFSWWPLAQTADGKASEVQDLLDGVFYPISSAEQQKSDPMMLKQKLSNLLTWSQLLFVCVIQRKTIHLFYFCSWTLPWSKLLSFLELDRSPSPSMSTRSLFTSESFRALRVTSAHTQHSLHFSVLFVHFCVFKIYKKLFTSYKKVVVFLMKLIKLLVESRMETCSLLFLQRRLAGGGTLETCCHDDLSCGHRDNSWRALRCSGNSKSGFLDDLLRTVRSCRRSSIFIWFPLHCALCQTAGGEMGAKLRIKLFQPTLGSLCTCDDTDESPPHVLCNSSDSDCNTLCLIHVYY